MNTYIVFARYAEHTKTQCSQLPGTMLTT